MEIRDYKDYEHCSSRDLICDPFFQEWMINPTAEREAFWREFLQRYPAAGEQVQTARLFLQGIAFRKELPDEAVVAASFEKHLEAIATAEDQLVRQTQRTPSEKGEKVRRLWKWAAAAVVIGVLLTAGLTWFLQSDGRQLHQTQYGHTKNIVLPDGSTVTLNANSSLEYTEDWRSVAVRDVWLKGEGYFSVKKAFEQGNGGLPQKFRVHTADLVIEVLGTTFDIRERRGITEVVLGTGSIELTFRDRAHGKILMKPGDRVVYDPKQPLPVRDTTNAADYSAWQQKKLILKNPTVNEITRYLEDNFGYKIRLEDLRMGNRTINGPILYDSLDDALFILSTVLNTEIIRKDSTIILRPR